MSDIQGWSSEAATSATSTRRRTRVVYMAGAGTAGTAAGPEGMDAACTGKAGIGAGVAAASRKARRCCSVASPSARSPSSQAMNSSELPSSAPASHTPCRDSAARNSHSASNAGRAWAAPRNRPAAAASHSRSTTSRPAGRQARVSRCTSSRSASAFVRRTPTRSASTTRRLARPAALSMSGHSRLASVSRRCTRPGCRARKPSSASPLR